MTLYTVVTERGPTLTRVIPLFCFFNLVTMDSLDVDKRFFSTDQAADISNTNTEIGKKITDGIKPINL